MACTACSEGFRRCHLALLSLESQRVVHARDVRAPGTEELLPHVRFTEYSLEKRADLLPLDVETPCLPLVHTNQPLTSGSSHEVVDGSRVMGHSGAERRRKGSRSLAGIDTREGGCNRPATEIQRSHSFCIPVSHPSSVVVNATQATNIPHSHADENTRETRPPVLQRLLPCLPCILRRAPPRSKRSNFSTPKRPIQHSSATSLSPTH